MKGLSLTLEIVIIAIVLLVTALVILTIFGGQMQSILATLGFFQGNTVQMTQCQTMCTNWCFANPGDVGKAGKPWGELTFDYQGKLINCGTVMTNTAGAAVGAKCTCNTA
jgi:hypothetical protein